MGQSQRGFTLQLCYLVCVWPALGSPFSTQVVHQALGHLAKVHCGSFLWGLPSPAGLAGSFEFRW